MNAHRLAGLRISRNHALCTGREAPPIEIVRHRGRWAIRRRLRRVERRPSLVVERIRSRLVMLPATFIPERRAI